MKKSDLKSMIKCAKNMSRDELAYEIMCYDTFLYDKELKLTKKERANIEKYVEFLENEKISKLESDLIDCRIIFEGTYTIDIYLQPNELDLFD